MLDHIRLLVKQLKTFLARLPSSSLTKVSDAMQKISITLTSAGLIGLTVTNDSITPGEALTVLGIGIGLFAYSTVIDIHISKSKEIK